MFASIKKVFQNKKLVAHEDIKVTKNKTVKPPSMAEKSPSMISKSPSNIKVYRTLREAMFLESLCEKLFSSDPIHH